MTKPTNVLSFSNSTGTPSGYGLQMRFFMPLIHQHPDFNWCVHATNYGIQGAPIRNEWGVLELPHFTDGGGNELIDEHVKRYEADLIFSLYDANVLQANVYGKYPTINWTPVDTVPVIDSVAAGLRGVRYIWSMSRHGHAELEKAGFEPTYVPHGVPSDVFRPIDRKEARAWLGEHLGVDLSNRFIVTLVAMNKSRPSRKNFWGTMRAFRAFSQQVPEAFLYIHTDLAAPGGEPLLDYVRRMDFHQNVGFPGRYPMAMGLFDLEDMNRIYNATDAYFTLSRSEGFCLPLLEAQMAGCPVIAPDALSMSELVMSGVRVLADPIQALNAREGGEWFEAIPGEAVRALFYMHEHAREMRDVAREKALAYDTQAVFDKHMLPALQKIRAELLQPDKAITVKPRLSVITNWTDNPQFIPAYEGAVRGADEVIIIDNGSKPENSRKIHAMVERLRGTYVRNPHYPGFAAGNNQGMALASGDILLFLNNDIIATRTDWLNRVRVEVKSGIVAGPSLGEKSVDNTKLPYIEGWCIAARREVWETLEGWDAEHFPFGYWEDSDLCYRAIEAGYRLKQTAWPLIHIGGGTGGQNKDKLVRYVTENYLQFVKRVRGLDMSNGNGQLPDRAELRKYARGIIRGIPQESETEPVT